MLAVRFVGCRFQTFVHRLETCLPPAINASTKFNLGDRTFAKISNTGTADGGGSSTTSRRNNVALVINDRNRSKILIFVL